MDTKITIKDMVGHVSHLTKGVELRSFLEAELAYWIGQKDNLGEKFPMPLASIPKNIGNLLDHFKNLEMAEEVGDPESENLRQRRLMFEQATQKFVVWAPKNWLYRGSPLVEVLLSVYEYSQESGQAFLDSIVNDRAHFRGTPPSLNTFSGVVLAHEYRVQDQSKLITRRGAEEKSFETLRKDLEGERNRLVTEISALREDAESWRDGTEEVFQNWFDRVQGDSGNWLAYLKKNSDARIEEHTDFFNSMANSAVTKIQDLETTYREKLRLAAPATYWKDRGKALGFQGGLWAVLLILVSICVAIGAGAFFWAWLHREPIEFGLQSLQGVALFGTAAAAAVFVIKTLSRLTFSAFHLQRDAEEREQLTHLYLALIHEGTLDTNSRDIVLQALFSRADSGLLAGDHGPTMPSPGDVVAGLSRIRPQ